MVGVPQLDLDENVFALQSASIEQLLESLKKGLKEEKSTSRDHGRIIIKEGAVCPEFRLNPATGK